MERKGLSASIGLCAVILMSTMGHEASAGDVPAQGRDTATVSAAAPAGDATGETSCSHVFNGYTITGYARLRVVTSGQRVTATVTEYRIAGASSSRNKANVDNDMRVWNNAAGTGEGKAADLVHSADAMRQDGQWHTLNQSVSSAPGFDVKRARVGVRFTFDMASGDPTCWATFEATL
ncbi:MULTISPECIES: hypothetical protein [unclassified Luteibacter]|uniref:hypothetical protein n=1 Tax=unclassified Luteibacter TaxID=2620188 RepID=UPI00056C6FA5|nr:MULTISPECIES: hypothetical protein [unclassified Luteibacter]